MLTLQLPPLRERPQDIETLAQHLAAKLARANGLPERPLSGGAIARLRALPWRGNVRELENCIHRAVVLAAARPSRRQTSSPAPARHGRE